MSKKSKLIIISGSSGSGKTTLVNYLMSYPKFNLDFSISACSRSKRKHEIDGKHYYFISIDEFKDKINKDQFLEWEEVYDNHFYGTLKSKTLEMLSAGKNILFDVDVNGGLAIKKYFKEKALTIFIKAPTLTTARERLIKRKTDSNSAIEFRVDKIKEEIIIGEKMDYQLINDDLAKSKKKIKILVGEFLDL